MNHSNKLTGNNLHQYIHHYKIKHVTYRKISNIQTKNQVHYSKPYLDQ